MSQEVNAAQGDGETPQDTPQEEETLKEAESQAQDTVDSLRERIRDLETRRTKEGRSRAQIDQEKHQLGIELTAARSEMDAARQINAQWRDRWLREHPEDRAAFEERAKTSALTEAQQTKAENAMLKAILLEENPTVKKILTAAVAKGEVLSKKQIDLIRENVGDSTVQSADTEEQDDEEQPPKVKSKRAANTRPSLDKQIEDAKKSKDTVALLNLMAEKQRLDKQGAS
jgi:hypothetical protein